MSTQSNAKEKFFKSQRAMITRQNHRKGHDFAPDDARPNTRADCLCRELTRSESLWLMAYCGLHPNWSGVVFYIYIYLSEYMDKCVCLWRPSKQNMPSWVFVFAIHCIHIHRRNKIPCCKNQIERDAFIMLRQSLSFQTGKRRLKVRAKNIKSERTKRRNMYLVRHTNIQIYMS